MANKTTANEEAAGTAIAALTLAKMVFWQLLTQGLLEKAEAEEMLRRAIASHDKGGPGDVIAAAKLLLLLRSIEIYQPSEQERREGTVVARYR
jgi:hypothetical protein